MGFLSEAFYAFIIIGMKPAGYFYEQAMEIL